MTHADAAATTWEVEPTDHDAFWRLDQAARTEVAARPGRWPAGAAIFASVDGVALGALHARRAMDELAATESEDFTQVQAIVAVVGLMGFTLATFDMLNGKHQADLEHRAKTLLHRLVAERPPHTMIDRVLLQVEAERAALDALLAAKVPSPFGDWYDLEAGFLAGYSLCTFRDANAPEPYDYDDA